MKVTMTKYAWLVGLVFLVITLIEFYWHLQDRRKG